MATQPNGSTEIALAGAPRIPSTSYTLAAQTQNTVIQNSTGTVATASKEAERVSVIQS